MNSAWVERVTDSTTREKIDKRKKLSALGGCGPQVKVVANVKLRTESHQRSGRRSLK